MTILDVDRAAGAGNRRRGALLHVGRLRVAQIGRWSLASRDRRAVVHARLGNLDISVTMMRPREKTGIDAESLDRRSRC